MDVPFDNIGVTNLVSDDVLEGENVDVIDPDGFDSDSNNDNETKAKDKAYLHSIESRRKLKLYKNDSVRVKARCNGKVAVFTMSRELSISMSKAFGAKAKVEREIRGDHVLQYSVLRDHLVELQPPNPNTTAKIAVKRNIDPSLPTRVFQIIYVCLGALKLGFRACGREMLGLYGVFMKGPFPGQVLAAVGLDSNNEIFGICVG
ncbi:hypothetical protein Tco_0520764 [Tanacetum coccineum]